MYVPFARWKLLAANPAPSYGRKTDVEDPRNHGRRGPPSRLTALQPDGGKTLLLNISAKVTDESSTATVRRRESFAKFESVLKNVHAVTVCVPTDGVSHESVNVSSPFRARTRELLTAG